MKKKISEHRLALFILAIVFIWVAGSIAIHTYASRIIQSKHLEYEKRMAKAQSDHEKAMRKIGAITNYIPVDTEEVAIITRLTPVLYTNYGTYYIRFEK